MRWADRSLTVGLCVSLLLHGAVFDTALVQYAHELSHLYLSAPIPRQRAVADVSVFNSPNAFGEEQGRGQSAQSEIGDQPLLAPEGEQVQALLSRDPQGVPGQPGSPSPSQSAAANASPTQTPPPIVAAESLLTPSPADAVSAPKPPSTPPPVHAADAPAPLHAPSPNSALTTTLAPADIPDAGQTNSTAVAIAIPHNPAPATPPPATPPNPPSPATPPSPPAQPTPAAPSPTHPPEPAPANANPPSPASPPPAPPGGGGGGGSPVAPGESDSDPFNKSVSVIVRPGGIEARTGRKLRKTVRPDLTAYAQTLLLGSGGGRVQLAVRIDPSGSVADVKILSSSGFGDVDLPCVQAMYQWNIEPSKDKTGKAVSDVIIITINFQ